MLVSGDNSCRREAVLYKKDKEANVATAEEEKQAMNWEDPQVKGKAIPLPSSGRYSMGIQSMGCLKSERLDLFTFRKLG